MSSKVTLKILRQDNQSSDPYWQSFQIPYQENMNVISALMELRKKPINVDGDSVSPPTWDAACLEEVCGSCTFYINGRIRQACTALIKDVANQIGDDYHVELRPMKKFPVIRDLQVDRSRMFENLKQIQAWVPIDGSYDLGMAAPQDDAIRHLRYSLSRCMTCGCCVEACPQVNDNSKFIGPAALGQTLLFNLHPIGKTLQNERLEVITSEAGITGCGNAQNCVKVCPKEIPLTRAIAELNRDTTLERFKKWMGFNRTSS